MNFLIYWIVALPLLAIGGSFAVSNRDLVILRLWPLPYEVEAPLYLLVLAILLVGFLFGALAAWLSGGRTRRRARAHSRELEDLRDELYALKAKGAAPVSAEQALPAKG